MTAIGAKQTLGLIGTNDRFPEKRTLMIEVEMFKTNRLMRLGRAK
jgi:hypothetical protein